MRSANSNDSNTSRNWFVITSWAAWNCLSILWFRSRSRRVSIICLLGSLPHWQLLKSGNPTVVRAPILMLEGRKFCGCTIPKLHHRMVQNFATPSSINCFTGVWDQNALCTVLSNIHAILWDTQTRNRAATKFAFKESILVPVWVACPGNRIHNKKGPTCFNCSRMRSLPNRPPRCLRLRLVVLIRSGNDCLHIDCLYPKSSFRNQIQDDKESWSWSERSVLRSGSDWEGTKPGAWIVLNACWLLFVKLSEGKQSSSGTLTESTVWVDCHLNVLWNVVAGLCSSEAATYLFLKLSQGKIKCPEAAVSSWWTTQPGRGTIFTGPQYNLRSETRKSRTDSFSSRLRNPNSPGIYESWTTGVL